MSSEEDFEYSDDEYAYDGSSAEEGAAADDDGLGPIALKRVLSYNVLKIDQVVRKKDELVEECSENLGLSESEAHIFLCYYKWNLRKLQEDWFDHPAKVKATVPCTSVVPSSKEHKGDSPDLLECPACYCDVKESEMQAVSCGHKFCPSCWEEYTSEALKRGVNCVYLDCMEDGCSEAVGPNFFDAALPADKRPDYQRFLLQSFCNNSKEIAWCPSPGCTYIIEYPGGGRTDINCVCGHKFCFHCVENAHRPASCEDVAKWSEKNSAESENVTWILANTKKCPKCRKPIEKNKGCNHMTCDKRSGGCSHGFCWLCMGDWKEHGQETGGFYRCNKYETMKSSVTVKEAESERISAKHSLEKYMHYYQRFMNHQRSRKFGMKTLRVIEEQMELLLKEKGYKITEVSFLKDAAVQVIECRRVLQWTYVCGYYLKDGPERELFEFLQENLEKNTETLHELVERPLEQFLADGAKPEVFFQHRSNVTNYSAVTSKFVQNLLDGVENGLTSELPLQHQPYKRART